MWIANGWKDYEVIDASGGEKLERWGDDGKNGTAITIAAAKAAVNGSSETSPKNGLLIIRNLLLTSSLSVSNTRDCFPSRLQTGIGSLH